MSTWKPADRGSVERGPGVGRGYLRRLMPAHRILYAATHRFSKLVEDHAAGDPFLDDFRSFPSTHAGLEQAASARAFSAEHRSVLVKALHRQYEGIDIEGPVRENIDRLSQPDALTVTTGHQLCLFTGPLYFPFKLLNTIRLARTLSGELKRPVVPIFWMASEDHDRAEIDHAWLAGKKIQWPGASGGAVGRLTLKGIEAVLAEVDDILGAGMDADRVRVELRRCYTPGSTLAEATRRFVHALFGRFGLVILDGDDRELKKLFMPVMREELLNGITQRSVSYADERLKERYPSQAHARTINVFHLRPGYRSRIEADGDHYQVLDGGPRFTLDELLLDLEVRPQDYSPNVLLRPVYQEVVLPNIAYIGGGGELAYWMQLKWLFQAVQAPMPVVLLRTSAAFLSAKQGKQRGELGLSIEDLFKPAHELRDRVAHHFSVLDTDVVDEQQELDAFFQRLRTRTAAVDATLGASTDAAQVRAQRLLMNLQGKMDRALRRKEKVHIDRLDGVLEALFPAGGLQERRDNLLPMLAAHGPELLDRLLETLDPLNMHFTVISED